MTRALAAILCLALAACGIKGDPMPPAEAVAEASPPSDT